MITEIGEPIVVAAIFRQGKIIPKQLLWQQRCYKIKKVIGYYHYFKGVYRQDCFSVNCGSEAIYEISLDTERMLWRLERIYSEG
jgi:hypothetical protein